MAQSPVPVCCVDSVPLSVVNKFLSETYAASIELVPETVHNLGIVHTAVDGSARVPEEPSSPPLTDFRSPCLGKTPEEIYSQLSLSPWIPFVVIDERSGRDDTVLVAQHTYDKDEMEVVRCAFKQAEMLLIGLSIANVGIQEVQHIASERGGVYTLGDPPKKGGNAPRKKLESRK